MNRFFSWSCSYSCCSRQRPDRCRSRRFLRTLKHPLTPPNPRPGPKCSPMPHFLWWSHPWPRRRFPSGPQPGTGWSCYWHSPLSLAQRRQSRRRPDRSRQNSAEASQSSRESRVDSLNARPMPLHPAPSVPRRSSHSRRNRGAPAESRSV
jgi:hypothetical protein